MVYIHQQCANYLKYLYPVSVPPKTGNTARNQPQHNSDANSTYVINACGIFKHEALKTVDFALRPEFKIPSILITYKHTGLQFLTHMKTTNKTATPRA